MNKAHYPAQQVLLGFSLTAQAGAMLLLLSAAHRHAATQASYDAGPPPAWYEIFAASWLRISASAVAAGAVPAILCALWAVYRHYPSTQYRRAAFAGVLITECYSLLMAAAMDGTRFERLFNLPLSLTVYPLASLLLGTLCSKLFLPAQSTQAVRSAPTMPV